MANNKKADHINCENGNESPIVGGDAVKWSSLSGKQVCSFLKNQINTHSMTCKHLSTYPRKIKLYIHIKDYMWMFIVALFIKMELKPIQMSINCRMDKQNVICPIKETLFHSKKETNDGHAAVRDG